MITLAFISFLAARYLAAFQLGHISNVWDPLFGDGTRRVLTSEVSRAWPISDAGLGSVSYLLEALMGFMGGQDRWRTMPWMVTIFGILVVPLGVVSIVLVVLQPVSVGAWCSLCLLTAALMLLMIPLTLDEVWAMGEFLLRSHRAGKPFLRTFFLGGTIEGGAEHDDRVPSFGSPLGSYFAPMVWGLSVPWNLALSVVAGLWLMLAPAALGGSGSAADSDRVLGALVITWSVVVTAEVARPARYFNALLGTWMAVGPWLLDGYTPSGHWNSIFIGFVVILLAMPSGVVRERFGLSEHYLRPSRPGRCSPHRWRPSSHPCQAAAFPASTRKPQTMHLTGRVDI